MNMNTDLFDLAAVAASATPVTMDLDGEEDVCPPAPRRRPRTPSEIEEAAAYDAVVRQLVHELTDRLEAQLGSDTKEDLPPVEGLMSPAGLERQQAMDSSLTPICTPRQVSETPSVVTPLKRKRALDSLATPICAPRVMTSPAVPVSPLMRRATDIEDDGDLSSGEEADAEDGGDAEAMTNTEAPLAEPDTSGVFCTLRRQPHTGQLALSLEAPVWMWGAMVVAATAYMWIVVRLIDG